MKFLKFCLLLSLFAALLRPLGAVRAQVSVCPGTETRWEQTGTQSFALIYPQNGADQALVSYIRDLLDGEYTRLAHLFQAQLLLPVNVRLYPREEDYYCLNTRAVRLSKGFTHAHLGEREIALIQEDYHASVDDWQAAVLNDFRYELGALFAETITDHKAPPGLVVGVGGYSRDPAQVITNRSPFGWARGSSPGWQRLWEDQEITTSGPLLVEKTSIVAFLADVYGWPEFIRYLHSIATSEDHQQALAAVYNRDVSDLHARWLEYVPYYLNGRWRAHVFYSFDLTAFETLLQAGAYEDAAAGLKAAIEFLDGIGDTEKAARARALLQQAATGLEAGAAAARTRQALLDHQYSLAFAGANEALSMYADLKDTRRVEEIQAYHDRAGEVIQLRAESQTIAASLAQGEDLALYNRLLEIRQRQVVLGDDSGQVETTAVLDRTRGRVQQLLEKKYLRIVPLVLALLGLRVFWLRRKPAPEVLR